jgi:hypothetical protein
VAWHVRADVNNAGVGRRLFGLLAVQLAWMYGADELTDRSDRLMATRRDHPENCLPDRTSSATTPRPSSLTNMRKGKSRTADAATGIVSSTRRPQGHDHWGRARSSSASAALGHGIRARNDHRRQVWRSVGSLQLGGYCQTQVRPSIYGDRPPAPRFAWFALRTAAPRSRRSIAT